MFFAISFWSEDIPLVPEGLKLEAINSSLLQKSKTTSQPGAAVPHSLGFLWLRRPRR
jgi:hypothetical protein